MERTGELSLAAVIALVLFGVTACMKLENVEYAEAVREGEEQLKSEEGLRVEGYVDAGDVRHSWPSQAHLNADGSLTFLREGEEFGPRRVPRWKVKALTFRKPDCGRIAGGVGVVVGVLAFTGIVLLKATVVILEIATFGNFGN